MSESKSSDSGTRNAASDHVGIIYTNLSLKESIDRCVTMLRNVYEVETANADSSINFPDVIIDGHVDARFSYIKVPLCMFGTH